MQILVWNHTCDFKSNSLCAHLILNSRMISDQIALHSVQLRFIYLFIYLIIRLFVCLFISYQVLRFQSMQYFDQLLPKQEINENTTQLWNGSLSSFTMCRYFCITL